MPSESMSDVTRVLLLFITLSIVGCCQQATIPANLKKLSSAKSRDKTEAAFALARCGSDADVAVATLANLLYDENRGVQSAAAYALRKIDTPAARSVMQRVESRKKS